jgi:nucleoside-diphosphate-sugar epimerase
MTPARIAVLGAGYIGTAAARALADRGAEVWAVRRSVQPSDAGLTWLAADLASGAVGGLPATLDAVVLSVAPGRGRGDSHGDTYPPAARTAVAVVRATGARALVYTSSTGVYGERRGAWVDELTPRHGQGPGNRALIQTEDILLQSGLTAVTILRVAGIYGPGRDPRARFAHPGLLPARGRCWVNLAHRHDIVSAIVASTCHEGAPRVLNVSDGTPTLAADVARWCAVVRGQDPKTLVFDNDEPPTRSNQRVSNAALTATGWRPEFPSFREGFTSGL